jgi:hypothetical protein
MTLHFSRTVTLVTDSCGSCQNYRIRGQCGVCYRPTAPSSRCQPFSGGSLPVAFSLRYDQPLARYSVEWEATGERISITGGSIEAKQVGLSATFGEGVFPPTKTGAVFGSTGQAQVSTVVVDVEFKQGSTTPTTLLSSVASAFLLFHLDISTDAPFSTGQATQRVAADVCLSFPRTGQQLWANEAVLSSASPYLKQLLSSSFVEGTATTSSATPHKLVAEYVFAESDEETDKIEMKKTSSKKTSSKKKEENETSEPFKTIAITDSAYSTYFAVLVWLQSRHIVFAPLLSTFLEKGKTRDEAISLHTAAISELINKGGTLLPPPVSPKSIYRLAHLLELESLPSLALSNLRSQLTPSIAAYELYSDAATCYPELRDVVLAYLVEHWKEVKGSKAAREMRAKADAGELDCATAGTAMLLAEKLVEKYVPA